MQIRMTMVSIAILLAAPAWGNVADVYKQADRNGDGEVDRAEFQQRQKDLFFFHDADKDGSLSAEELGDPSAADVIRTGDRNGDGKLQLDEFLDVRARAFRRADKDRSGTLSVEEVEAAEE